MKTLKNTIILAGIIVALFSLTAHATEKKGGEKSVAEKKEIKGKMSIDKSLEFRLIAEYLEEQEIVEVAQAEKKVKIYGSDDQLVYEGNDDEARVLKLSADFLMEHENVSYYRLDN